MARKQRWRRGRSTGVDTNSVVDPSAEADEPTAVVDEVDVEVDDQADGEAGVADEPAAVEDDERPDGDAASDSADDEPDADDDEEADDEEADDEEAEALEDLPPVLPAARSTGPLDWMFGGNPADHMAVQLIRAAHAKQALTTALAMGLAAAVAGRAAREAAVVALTVLIGQAVLGWVNDVVDRRRDIAHKVEGKPLANGKLSTEAVWYAIVVGICLLVPMAITSGIKAGCIYLASVAVGVLGNVLLRTGFFSWWSWAVSYAMLPAYLSLGGWGGQAEGHPPEVAIVALAALLGVGVHFMRSVWGLVADHEDGWTYLPLKVGLKLGATRLLALSTLYSTLVVIGIVIAASRVGLSQ